MLRWVFSSWPSYISPLNYELVWVTPHSRYGQRESASIRGKCQPPPSGFPCRGEKTLPPRFRSAIIRRSVFTDNCLSFRGADALETAKKNVAVLATCQALLFTNNSTAIALNGLAGYALAANKALATLPVTAWVIGGALSTFPASLLMKRIGRRAGFTVGALTGMVGAAICSLALSLGNFWLFCFGTMVFGVYNAVAQYY